MLGWRTREPLVAAADDRHVLPGGGIIRPVVLARGRAAGTWRLDRIGRAARASTVEWFGRPPAGQRRRSRAESATGRRAASSALDAPASPA